MLDKHPFFADLTVVQKSSILGHVTIEHFPAGAVILKEGDFNHTLYFIASGSVRIMKKTGTDQATAQIARLGAGECFGEMSVAANIPATSSVIAETDAEIYKVPFDSNSLSTEVLPAKFTILKKMFEVLVKRVHDNDMSIVQHLRMQLDEQRLHLWASLFLTRMFVALSLYTLGIRFVDTLLQQNISSTSIVSSWIIGAFALASYFSVRASPFGFKAFGFSFLDWKKHAFDALQLTIPVVIAVTLAKFLWIYNAPEHYPLFDPTLALSTPSAFTWSSYLVLMLVYSLLAVAQELVHCSIQAFLQIYYGHDGKSYKWKPIFVSTILFSATHTHLSLMFAFIVFWPGIFWAWMYYRQRSIIGVAVSHIVLGVWTIFILGIPG